MAQCPALRVLELGNGIALASPGTFDEALYRLVESRLDLLRIHCEADASPVRTPNNR